jgi:positive regulator of sigma E activity
MKEQGKVIKKENDEAVIEIKPHEECHKCGACGIARPRNITVSGEASRGLKEGDMVEVEIEPPKMLMLYFILYGLPLLVFAVTIFVLYAATKSPLGSFSGALALMALSFVGAGFYMRKNSLFSPHVTKKY